MSPGGTPTVSINPEGGAVSPREPPSPRQDIAQILLTHPVSDFFIMKLNCPKVLRNHYRSNRNHFRAIIMTGRKKSHHSKNKCTVSKINVRNHRQLFDQSLRTCHQQEVVQGNQIIQFSNLFTDWLKNFNPAILGTSRGDNKTPTPRPSPKPTTPVQVIYSGEQSFYDRCTFVRQISRPPLQVHP